MRGRWRPMKILREREPKSRRMRPRRLRSRDALGRGPRQPAVDDVEGGETLRLRSATYGNAIEVWMRGECRAGL